MKLKKLLGTNAHWSINKTLYFELGFEATLFLQHLIDLEDSFFNGIEFFQQDDRISEDLGISTHLIRKARNLLVEKNIISCERKGMPAKMYYTINTEEILNILNLDNKSSKPLTTSSEPSEQQLVNRVNNKSSTPLTGKTKNLETKNIETKNTVTDKNVDPKDDVRKNLFWKGLVPKYPANRLGNRQHNLKKWMKLNDTEMKEAITNLERYLKLSNGFVKTLGNYIEERCFSAAWLTEQENLNKKKKQDRTNTSTHNFSGDYSGDGNAIDIESFDDIDF